MPEQFTQEEIKAEIERRRIIQNFNDEDFKTLEDEFGDFTDNEYLQAAKDYELIPENTTLEDLNNMSDQELADIAGINLETSFLDYEFLMNVYFIGAAITALIIFVSIYFTAIKKHNLIIGGTIGLIPSFFISFITCWLWPAILISLPFLKGRIFTANKIFDQHN